LKVFLDTNVLVAAFATRGLCSDVVRLVLAEHDLVVSETILAELGRVLADKIGLPDRAVRAVVRFVRQRATVMPPGSPAPPITPRDPGDVAVLADALVSGAEVLVTGDRDLLVLPVQRALRVVDPRGFWELVSRRPKA